jgi:hypothetical protein
MKLEQSSGTFPSKLERMHASLDAELLVPPFASPKRWSHMIRTGRKT